MNNKPSIFNDVIGPEMRGPSSSHTAASWRIARVCREIMNRPLKTAVIDFDKDGAWAANYREQGTTMGIDGGLLGLDITDDRMKHTEAVAEERGVLINYEISSFPTRHPNTVRLTLEGTDGKKTRFTAASTGGGAFEIQTIASFEVDIRGDSFETLIWNTENGEIPEDIVRLLSRHGMTAAPSERGGGLTTEPSKRSDDLMTESSKRGSDTVQAKSSDTGGTIIQILSPDRQTTLINIKSSKAIPPEMLNRLQETFGPHNVVTIQPVLPVVSGNETELPFNGTDSLLAYTRENGCDLGDAGIIYEQCRSGLTTDELKAKMEDIIATIENSIAVGLAGTDYEDRILHRQSHMVERAEREGKLLEGSIVNKIVASVTAVMEAKSAFEVIVANPTAGSCGTVGGVLKAVAEKLDSPAEALVKAYFAAGLIGVSFARGPGFSAEEHGCQVECGAASGMAAAGIVQLMGGTAEQAVAAASLAIQNMIGLICDPVADRVEVPCLGKNISAAMNALSSATMARTGFDAVVPLEEVIETVTRVGNGMLDCVKCTGKGGLSVTPTSVRIKERLR